MTAHQGVTAEVLAQTIIMIVEDEMTYEPLRFCHVQNVRQLHREYDDQLVDLATEVLGVRFDLLDPQAQAVIDKADALLAKPLGLV